MGVQEAVVHVPREGRQGGQLPKQKSRRKRKEDVHGSNEYAEEVLLVPHELGLGVNDARGLYGRPCDCPSSLRKPRPCAFDFCAAGFASNFTFFSLPVFFWAAGPSEIQCDGPPMSPLRE